ncbi:MAG: macro domain-containing protein [Pseudomonadota bacterium]
MSLNIIKGNIFTSDCQTIVNTINCVGAMGAGIALEYRLRYPEMYKKYTKLCEENRINIGMLWIYKSPDRWILNFPTKKHWKYPSKHTYLHAGLKKFVATYKDKGITSIAFPLLGADKGGIPQEESLEIMESYLADLDIDVEVYKYSPDAEDDLYSEIKAWLLSQEIDYISKSTGLRKDYVIKVLDAMQSKDICQLNQIGRVQGIGINTLEKIFGFVRKSKIDNQDSIEQQLLL